MSIVDLEVGPYDSADRIRAEIERVQKLPKSDERDVALATLRRWLASAEQADQR